MAIKESTIEEIYSAFNNAGRQVCTDTRNIAPGSVFFALKGENFDGNLYAEKAIEAGCAFAVVSDAASVKNEKYFLVKDTLKALQDLGHHHRMQFEIPVIAITGSNGKTTTKELMHAVLSKKYITLSTIGNLNNHIGVPLTLLRLDEKHEMAIIEMGANHQGEIKLLCEIAAPGFGVITNIGKAHLEGFGGEEGIKKGKGELYNYLKDNGGKIFVHGDDVVLMEMAGAADKVTYGSTKLFDVVGNLSGSEGMVEFKWKTRYTASAIADAPIIKTNLVGKYNYVNLLCAACVGNYFHVEEKEINEALSSYIPSNNRSQLFDSGKNKLILDMYNANPSSMMAAIDNFSQMKAVGKIVILGDMLELGTESKDEHENIVKMIREKKFEKCYLVGPSFKQFEGISDCKHFTNSDEAIIFFSSANLRGKTILLKGSRGIKLEQLVPTL